MKYIRLNTTDPYYNLAVEEFLFRSCEDDIFMLWQNAPSVIVGKNQNVYAETDIDYTRKNGIFTVRRITGGGAVYHDLGNINYSFITSKSRAAVLDFAYFTSPIISALSSLGIECALSGRNDLECAGRKFSGNAQAGSDDRILHHGTLLFDTDLDKMSAALKADREKLEYKAVKSHKSRVVNLSDLLQEQLTAEEFIGHIERHIIENMNAERLDAPQNSEIISLYQRNSSDEWIYSDRRYLTSYSINRRKKYHFGIVNIGMSLNKDVIESIIISGDFFGTRSIHELEEKLTGMTLCDVKNIDPSPYIDKMTRDEFFELLK